MNAGGGARKGSAAERLAAREISAWWYKGKPGADDFLWRNAAQQQRGRKARPHEHTGDVMPVASRVLPYPFDLHVEVKYHAAGKLQLARLLVGAKPTHPVIKFWRKARDECRSDLTVMLFLKENSLPPLCIVSLAFVIARLPQLMVGGEQWPIFRMAVDDVQIVATPWSVLRTITVTHTREESRVRKNV